jgi:hypothetical protein
MPREDHQDVTAKLDPLSEERWRLKHERYQRGCAQHEA